MPVTSLDRFDVFELKWLPNRIVCRRVSVSVRSKSPARCAVYDHCINAQIGNMSCQGWLCSAKPLATKQVEQTYPRALPNSANHRDRMTAAHRSQTIYFDFGPPIGHATLSRTVSPI